jgi:hypothetical protein
MKNSQKGFAIPIIIAILALLAVGGGAYIYTNNKVEAPANIPEAISNTPTSTQKNITTDKTTTPLIQITSPYGKEIWRQNGEYNISWVSSNINKNDHVSIILRSTTNYFSACLVGSSLAENGSFKITPSKVICAGSIDDKKSPDFIADLKKGGLFKVQVVVSEYSEGRGVADLSDDYITITSD